MIKGLMGNSGVMVNGGNTSVPYVNQNSNNPIQGMIRIWGNDMQVYDGSSWLNMSTSYATVGLDVETQEILQWAKAQRQIALNKMERAQKNPALMKALEAIKRAEDNFDILDKIVGNDIDVKVSSAP